MAPGKIKADTLEHSTAGSLDTSYVVNGSAKAWADFNQASINGSNNISTITDSNTGRYVVNMTNNMSNSNFAISACINNPESSGGDHTENSSVGRSSGTVPVKIRSADVYYDPTRTQVIIHGDLA